MANSLKGLTTLTGHNSLALQQDERFAMPWNETDREKYAAASATQPTFRVRSSRWCSIAACFQAMRSQTDRSVRHP